jgi:hypothetical protein
MPLGASIPLGVGFYLIFRAVAGPVLVDPLFVGFAPRLPASLRRQPTTPSITSG